MITKLQRFEGALLGLACGDAVGTTVEFKTRGSFPPVKDMVGGGPFRLKRGEWTDDTSMALCLADSLLAANRFDAQLTMELFCAWRYDGYLSSTGTCFDIGGVTSSALSRYARTLNPFAGDKNPNTAGNGALMRLAPVVMFFHSNRSRMMTAAGDSTLLTHGADECFVASQIFGYKLWLALNGASKMDIVTSKGVFYFDIEDFPKLTSIAKGSYRGKIRGQINGDGYVVNSLESALWCFYHSDSYKEAVLLAANLGDDADTTAAIVGQLAGAYYGVNGIPANWRKWVKYGKEIRIVAKMLMGGRHGK